MSSLASECITNFQLLFSVSESHRTFNYGYTVPDAGPYAWLWDPVTKLIWHGKDKEAYFPDEDGKKNDLTSHFLYHDLFHPIVTFSPHIFTIFAQCSIHNLDFLDELNVFISSVCMFIIIH